MSKDRTTMLKAGAERSDFLRLPEELSPEQWEASTLCGSWRVQNVVAHASSYEDLSPAATVALFLRGRLSFARINDQALRPFRAFAPRPLTDRMCGRQRPRGLTGARGGGIALADGWMFHQQDIRRPLQMARVTIAAARVLRSLQIALRAPTLPSRRQASCVRLVATDAD